MRSSRLGVLGLVLLLALCPLCTMASRTALLPAARCAAMKAAVTEPLRHDDTLDTPGILWMEHLNLIVGERSCAEAFYIDFLGFAAEPGSSFHVNLGSQQFHLKDAAEAHLLTGTVGLAVPSLDALRERHSAARAALQDTKFDVADHGDCMAVVCPWGNSFACYEAKRELPSGSGDLPKMVAAQVGMDESMAVRGAPGIRFTSFRVRPGTAPRVGLFYETIFGCKVSYGDDGRSATVSVGPSVHLIFEDNEARPLTDDEERRQAGPGGGVGLHVCIYIANLRPRTTDWTPSASSGPTRASATWTRATRTRRRWPHEGCASRRSSTWRRRSRCWSSSTRCARSATSSTLRRSSTREAK